MYINSIIFLISYNKLKQVVTSLNRLKMATRREFIQKSAIGAAGLTLSAKSYSRISGANDRVRVGIIGFSDRFRSSLAPAFLSQAQDSKKIVQIGSQRRSTPNYIAANDYIRSGKFGKIVMVEMSWNVNQPGRWRRPQLTSVIKEADTDWKRFQINREPAAWDPRKYLEFRLFWPYSSGIPGQWMAHQIDTVHWFTGLSHPRSVAANGGIYLWKDGRTNFDTMTAVMDYGDANGGFQVVYTSRFTNSAGGTKEIYFSNGGSLNLDTNKINSDGGLNAGDAKE